VARRSSAWIAYRPALGNAHNNLGTMLQAMGRSGEALAAFDRALKINGNHAAAHANRGNVLMDQGRFQEAASAFERALDLDPSLTENHSNYLSCLNYDPTRTDEELLAAHRSWGARHGRPECLTRQHASDRDPERRLRVGLVSADLGRHPVGYLVQPLMAAADPGAIVFYCYSGRLIEDDLSESLRSRARAWRRTNRLSDTELAHAIRADGIDILIDLAGHTAGNRLGCFALKPAPVQVHWAGYAYTTGLAAIDYALWDAVHVPDGGERWFTETVVRLPVRWCYGRGS
jgi:protein O-GlcNAc transferase